MEKIKAFIKYLLSFRKTEWVLKDFPIRIQRRENDPEPITNRKKPVSISTQIVNWYQIAGHGESEKEALANLERCFENYKNSHASLPRPGTGAPLEFAETTKVGKYETIGRDFFDRILGVDYDSCFISDESSLWDFSDERSNDEYYRKISILYGVDVSDIDGAELWKIFQRINQSGRNLTSRSS